MKIKRVRRSAGRRYAAEAHKKYSVPTRKLPTGFTPFELSNNRFERTEMKTRMKKAIGLSVVIATTLGVGGVTGCVYRERTVYSDGSTVQTDSAVVVADAPPAPIV